MRSVDSNTAQDVIGQASLKNPMRVGITPKPLGLNAGIELPSNGVISQAESAMAKARKIMETTRSRGDLFQLPNAQPQSPNRPQPRLSERDNNDREFADSPSYPQEPMPRGKNKYKPYKGTPDGPLFDITKGKFFGPNDEEEGVVNRQDVKFGQYRLIAEYDDFMICEGYDPFSKTYQRELAVAKPRLLRRSPFDGQTIAYKNLSVSYEYTGLDQRIARATVDGRVVEELQRVTEDYVVGDTIFAVPVQSSEHSLVEGGIDIGWVDINFGGRAWAVDTEEDQ
jgi:hypothetical protein